MVDLKHYVTLDVSGVEDRSMLAAILTRNGYGVAQGKRKNATGRSYIYTLEVYKKIGEEKNGN